MNQLQILENGLVPIYTSDTGGQVVDGRELWEALESKQEFANWVKNRFNECDAKESVDFTTLDNFIRREGSNLGSKRTEYIIKLTIAKEMAMLERNEKGKQVRKYFISIEEKYNQQAINVSELSPELQMFKQIWDGVAKTQLEQIELRKQLTTATEKVNSVENTLSVIQDTIVQRDDDWRKSINKMLNNAVTVSGTGDYRVLRQRTYETLEERARCRLNVKLNNLKTRLEESGSTKSKINAASKLDVIENDVRLKEIYTSIVKEFSIRYIPKEQTELEIV